MCRSFFHYIDHKKACHLEDSCVVYFFGLEDEPIVIHRKVLLQCFISIMIKHKSHTDLGEKE